MTKEEILEKHYRKYFTRIPYPEFVFAAMEEYATQTKKENIEALKGIDAAFPCEVGDKVIMEEGKTYDEVRLANYYRREGAKIERQLTDDYKVKIVEELKQMSNQYIVIDGHYVIEKGTLDNFIETIE